MAHHHDLVFKEPLYDGQLSRTLAASYCGMADLGETFAAAYAIGKPTPDRWYEEWSKRATTACEGAIVATESGQDATARSLWLRASEYSRQAYFFLRHDLSDPRLHAAYKGQVDAFVSAIPFLGVHVETLAIPYEGKTLKGYLFAPDGESNARPTVLFPCGYDSAAEEGWTYASAAVQRGYTAVVFEGPGQGGALYDQGLVFRPDFNAVVTPLIDVLTSNPKVDASRVILVGNSFAGYLAPQAATVEHRIAALVCNPAQPDMAAHLPKGVMGRLAAPVSELEMHISANKDEFFGSRMATHGVTTPEQYFETLRQFTMLNDASSIECPTLLVECEGDFAGGGGPALAAAMGDRATLVTLTAASGAGGHCAGLGLHVWEDVVYTWLHSILK